MLIKYKLGYVVEGIVALALATTFYFIGKNDSREALAKANVANSTLNAEKIKLEDSAQYLTKKQQALVDSLESFGERKKDYQTGFSILSKYLDQKVNVREKIIEAYSRRIIKNGEAARWMLGKVPPYTDKSQVKPVKKK